VYYIFYYSIIWYNCAVKCLFSCQRNTKPNIKLHAGARWRGTLNYLGKISSEPFLFEFNIPRVHPTSQGRDSQVISMGWSALHAYRWQPCRQSCPECQSKGDRHTFHSLSEPWWLVRETFTFKFFSTHEVSTKAVNRKKIQSYRSLNREKVRDCDRTAIIHELTHRKSPPQLSYPIAKCRITHRLVNVPPV